MVLQQQVKEEKDWGRDMGITGREQRERTRGRAREGRNYVFS
jgi:hypothetical protein